MCLNPRLICFIHIVQPILTYGIMQTYTVQKDGNIKKKLTRNLPVATRATGKYVFIRRGR